MNSRTTGLLLIGLVIAVFIITACSSDRPKQNEQLGELNFVVTGKSEAQPWFKKGLLLLHSFEYEDAAENFSKAREIDPGFAMAYWGEAMTFNHALWRYQDKNKADSVLAILGASAEERILKAQTPVEKDFIAAVNTLYGQGSKIERDQKYADYMGELFKKYPGDLEVASFYSIALLGSVDVGRDTKVYEQAAEIAKEVLAKNPNHPGALHYLIHSYDDPDHAALALNAADAYAKVAPSASHALHMPSHIYLALGLWDKVISSNEASSAAAQQRKERKKLDNDALGYHSLHWLMYGYLQQGRKEDARKILDSMQRYCNEFPSKRGRTHVILIKSTYLVEANEWESPASNIEVESDDLNISLRAANNFAEGMHAYSEKDAPALANIISKMKGERLIDNEKITGENVAGCMNITPNAPNLLDVQYAEVMEMELNALHAWLKNDTVTAQNWLKQATELENSISYSFGPPTIVKPSNELYGEWLLEINQPEEALKQFELALKAAPKRTLSVNGIAAATALLNGQKELANK